MAVTSILHHAATETIPVIRNSTKVKNYIRDDELKQKCQRSKVAWRHWRNAGRPRSGPLYQNMKAAKYEVKLCQEVQSQAGKESDSNQGRNV